MCPDIQEWHMSLYAARELTGIVRWPIYCLCWSVRDFAEALKSRFFCYQCGWLICKRVERDFCSEKCAKEFLPFQSKGARRSGTDGYADRSILKASCSLRRFFQAAPSGKLNCSRVSGRRAML